MIGAREYAMILGTGFHQHEKLAVEIDCHARGYTCHIWVLPSKASVKSRPALPEKSVEVYGIVDGQPGWTEKYGWIHTGPWQQDFERFVKSEKLRKKAERMRNEAEGKAESEKRRVAEIEVLEAYNNDK